MRKNLVIVGIILVVLGIGLWIVGDQMVMSIDHYFGTVISPEDRATLQTGNALMSWGMLIGAIGLFVIIVGLLIDELMKKQ